MNLRPRFSTLASCLLVAASVAGCAARTSTSEDEGRDESPLGAGHTQDIINDQAPKTPLGPSKGPSVPVYGGGVGEGSSGTGAPVATCTPSKTLHTCTRTFDGLATTVNAVSSDTCGNATSCGNYICDPAYGVCVDACEAAADCATGFTCIGAQCVLPPGFSSAPADPLPHALTDPDTCFTTAGGCADDHTEVSSCNATTTRDCGLFACVTGTGCKTTCETANDCATGSVCGIGNVCCVAGKC